MIFFKSQNLEVYQLTGVLEYVPFPDWFIEAQKFFFVREDLRKVNVVIKNQIVAIFRGQYKSFFGQG